MPETTILCKDCESERQRIEESGVGNVISCEPISGQEDKPEEEKHCLLIWEDNPL